MAHLPRRIGKCVVVIQFRQDFHHIRDIHRRKKHHSDDEAGYRHESEAGGTSAAAVRNRAHPGVSVVSHAPHQKEVAANISLKTALLASLNEFDA